MKHQDIVAWLELGERLSGANRERFAEIVQTLQRTADAQEAIAAHDDQLVLRAERPSKRYQA